MRGRSQSRTRSRYYGGVRLPNLLQEPEAAQYIEFDEVQFAQLTTAHQHIFKHMTAVNIIWGLVVLNLSYQFYSLFVEKDQCEPAVHPISPALQFVIHLVGVWMGLMRFSGVNNQQINQPPQAVAMLPPPSHESIAVRKDAEKYRRENKKIIEAIAMKLNLDLEKVASELICPIDLELLSDPAMIQNGEVYNFSAIMSWLTRPRQTAPATSAALSHTEVCNHFGLQSKIKHALQVELLREVRSGRIKLTADETTELLPDKLNLVAEISLFKRPQPLPVGRVQLRATR
jgi:hypothetical protein